jgi:hypothetical protein
MASDAGSGTDDPCPAFQHVIALASIVLMPPRTSIRLPAAVDYGDVVSSQAHFHPGETKGNRSKNKQTQ